MVALCGSAYLTYVTLTEGGQAAGCSAESSCDEVLNSKWSKWLGVVPVSALAMMMYALMLAGTVLLASDATVDQRRTGWTLLSTASLIVLGAGGWFVLLQWLVIEAWCPWCLSEHLCGAVIAIMILLRAPFAHWANRQREGVVAPGTAATAVLIAVVGITAVILGQFFGKQTGVLITGTFHGDGPDADIGQTEFQSPPDPPIDMTPTLEVPKTPTLPLPTSNTQMLSTALQPDPTPVPSGRPYPVERVAEFFGGKLKVALPLPMIGPLDADHFTIEMFDYCCPHCRSMHSYIKKLRARYGNQLAVVTMPVPLNSHCNPDVKKENDRPRFKDSCRLSRLAYGVWIAKPEAYADMHEWLMTGKNAPSADAAHGHAVELVGSAALERAMTYPWIDAQITGNRRIYNGTKGKDRKGARVPKLVLKDRWKVHIVPKDDEGLQQLFAAFEAAYGLKPLYVKGDDPTQPFGPIGR